jgi:hypothetical protein
MHQQDLKLEIASRLLSGIISQDRNRQLSDRLDDIDHSIDVAGELIRRSAEDQGPPTVEHTLNPPATTRTRERVIERELPPLSQRLQTRRGDATPNPGKGPTLH